MRIDERPPSKKEEEKGIEYNFFSQKLEKLKFCSSQKSDAFIVKQRQKVYEFFKCLVTAHECYPNDHKIKISYEGSSPDEITLVDFAQMQGFELIESTEHLIQVKKYF